MAANEDKLQHRSIHLSLWRGASFPNKLLLLEGFLCIVEIRENISIRRVDMRAPCNCFCQSGESVCFKWLKICKSNVYLGACTILTATR